MLNIGDIVIYDDIDRDLGLVVDHYTDPADGYVYIMVQWLGDESGDLCHIVPCCLEALC